MTDLNKEREVFLGFLRTKGVVKVGWNSLGVLTNLVREAGCTLGYNDIELMQEVWMEKAKAQAVPEGYVLVRRDATKAMIEAGDDLVDHNGYGTCVDMIWDAMVEASESGAAG